MFSGGGGNNLVTRFLIGTVKKIILVLRETIGTPLNFGGTKLIKFRT